MEKEAYFERAAYDRSLAEQSDLPRIREQFLNSAAIWESLGIRAQRAAEDNLRRMEVVGARSAELKQMKEAKAQKTLVD